MKLLVTGGAGYIGSVVTALLLAEGHEVAVLDDLSTGHADAVPDGAAFVRGTIRDDAAGLLASGIDAVLHFAAKSLVGESMAEPAVYWGNNLGGSLALLEAMRATGTARIVFSSTAAVYGEPEHTPIPETAPTRPTSPYGGSKVAVDTALTEHARMHGTGAVSLRYFNVAGAYAGPDGRWLGERHRPETHLIPNVLAVAAGRSAGKLQLYGDDYPTPDGTCIRDYIHVADLARAHLAALDACLPGEHRVYNLGSESGLLQPGGAGRVPGGDRAWTSRSRCAPRRPGDPAVLVASSARIKADLGWQPELDLRAWSRTRGRSPRRWPDDRAGRARGDQPGQRGALGLPRLTQLASGSGAVRRRPARDLAGARPGQPDRRAHRLQRRVRAAVRAGPGHATRRPRRPRRGMLELCSRQAGRRGAAAPTTWPTLTGPVRPGAPYPAGPPTRPGWPGRCARPATRWPGARMAIDSDLPQGAGLSSSAALECAVALALTQLARAGRAPAGAGRDRPPGRERLRRRAVRDHGPVRVAALPGRPRPAAGLLQRRDRTRCRSTRPPRAWPC